MAKLGSSFPPGIIESHVKSILQIGAVLRFHAADIRNPKIKRFVILGTCTAGGVVGKIFINSGPQAPDYQIFFPVAGRSYLDHDSFVDCSSIYPDIYDSIFQKVKADLSCYLGKVSDSDMASLIRTLRAAKTISNRDKVMFGVI